MQKHLFVMDPIAKLNLALDSSLRLAFALSELDHKIFICHAEGLSADEKNVSPKVSCAEVRFFGNAPSAKVGDFESDELDQFTAIHMRKDPPYDLNYIATVWLLSHVEDRVRIYNSPRGLLSVNEKLSILRFPDFIDHTLVSSNAEEIFDFIESQCQADAMVKPLTLYGGKGIERISWKNGNEQRRGLVNLEKLTEGNTVYKIVQPFNAKIYDGEVRAFLIGGKSLAWCLKKPASGQYMANSNFGSTRHKYEPTAKELELAITVAESLAKNFDIPIVGLDLIGGKLSEINVTSPRLLVGENDSTNYYELFAKWIVKDCETLNRR